MKKEDLITEGNSFINRSNSFEHRYKFDLKAQNYKTSHSFRVKQVCRTYGGDLCQRSNTNIISEEDFNNGTSLASFLVEKSKKGSLSPNMTSTLFSEPKSNKSVAPMPMVKPILKKKPSFLHSFRIQRSLRPTKEPEREKVDRATSIETQAASEFMKRMLTSGIEHSSSNRRHDVNGLNRNPYGRKQMASRTNLHNDGIGHTENPRQMTSGRFYHWDEPLQGKVRFDKSNFNNTQPQRLHPKSILNTMHRRRYAANSYDNHTSKRKWDHKDSSSQLYANQSNSSNVDRMDLRHLEQVRRGRLYFQAA